MRVVSVRGCPRPTLLKDLAVGDVFEFILDPCCSTPNFYIKMCPDTRSLFRICSLGERGGSSFSSERDLGNKEVRKVPAHLVVGEE